MNIRFDAENGRPAQVRVVPGAVVPAELSLGVCDYQAFHVWTEPSARRLGARIARQITLGAGRLDTRPHVNWQSDSAQRVVPPIRKAP